MRGSLVRNLVLSYGNNWVVLGIVVTLPFCSRPVCLPVLARLVVKDTTSGFSPLPGPPRHRHARRRAARPCHSRGRGRRLLRQPWYITKTQPSTADMLTKLRRVLIATKYRPSRPDQPTPSEIHVIQLAWEDTAA